MPSKLEGYKGASFRRGLQFRDGDRYRLCSGSILCDRSNVEGKSDCGDGAEIKALKVLGTGEALYLLMRSYISYVIS